MAAVTCILAPLAIPIGPIPISLTNLVVYFTVYVIGLKAGTCSYCLYVLLGVVGLPVFSGYVGGPAKIAGPTGGYIAVSYTHLQRGLRKALQMIRRVWISTVMLL